MELTLLLPTLSIGGKSAKAEALESSPDGARRIMIVDDEADIVAVLSTNFKNSGFAIHAYTNPRQALIDFRPGFYDALLLDVRMPLMDGFELYRNIRQMDSKVNICFLTAFETAKNVYNELIAPADKNTLFVKKPISSRVLIKIIEAALTITSN